MEGPPLRRSKSIAFVYEFEGEMTSTLPDFILSTWKRRLSSDAGKIIARSENVKKYEGVSKSMDESTIGQKL